MPERELIMGFKHWTPKEIKIIGEGWKSGLSDSAIANKLLASRPGVKPAHVSAKRAKMGWHLRAPSASRRKAAQPTKRSSGGRMSVKVEGEGLVLDRTVDRETALAVAELLLRDSK